MSKSIPSVALFCAFTVLTGGCKSSQNAPPLQGGSATPGAQPGSAQAANTQAVTPQPAPAQNASAQTKPSPFHAIGEFFERLIPHHNGGAASGATN